MPDPELEKIVQAVQKNQRYAAIDTDLVAAVASEMLKKGFSAKETVKRTRAKLHQVGGAYQEQTIPYEMLQEELFTLSPDLHAPQSITFVRKAMQFHRSTEERLNLLDTVFEEIFAELPPVHSILDLACGFNPLARAWMPIGEDCEYLACDIYPQMIGFLNGYFQHYKLPGKAFLCDLTTTIPEQEVDLGFLFKTIPCLEQLDKTIAERLLQQLNAKAAVVSFPVRSLGGRKKNMPQFYESRFLDLVSNTNWQVSKIATPDELFFLLKR